MRRTAVPPALARLLALGGLIFFIDALVYFEYRYVVVFGREARGPTDTRAIVADVVIFSVFALHHSVFARDAFRNRITQIVGALERSFYVWIASALFIAVCALWRPVAGVAWRVTQPVAGWVLTAAQLAGIWLSLRSASLIDIRELSGLKQLDAPSIGGLANARPAAGLDAAGLAVSGTPQFNTRGPYGWVRHPIYSGWFLIVFAVSTMTMTRLVFAVTSSTYLLIAIPFEERSLRRSSKGAYEHYMRKVPWKLVPRLF